MGNNCVIIGEGGGVKLLSGATTTGAGTAWQPIAKDRTYQATVVGTGAVSSTVTIEVSNNYNPDDSSGNWITLATISLSGATSDSDGASSVVPWKWTRANVTAVSGTGAAVTVVMAT
jgi:hypothetical protein